MYALHVHMYVCMRMCIYEYMYVCMYMCIYEYMYICLYASHPIVLHTKSTTFTPSNTT
jgi:hypothetical protein